MARLNPSAFITAQPIDNFSVQVANDATGFIGLDLFPPLMVTKKTGEWYQYTKDHLRLENADAPSGSEAPAVTYSAFRNTYTCTEKAYKSLVLNKDARDFDVAVADLDRDASEMNTMRLMADLEDRVHTKATTSTNYPSAQVLTLSSGDTWADSSSDPLDDVRNMRQATFDACGKYPNVMALSKKALDYLRIHPGIRELTKYTMAGPVPMELIASLMDLERIYASSAIKNTAKEGAADSLSSIWDDDAVLAYVPKSLGLKSMAYGRTVMVNQLYNRTIDAPHLGRGLGAHWLETGFEYVPEFAAQVSDSDADAIAGALIVNVI